METDWSVDHGPYSEFGDLLTLRGAQFMGAGYNIPQHPRRRPARSAPTTPGARPSGRYGSPQSRIRFTEVLMDELAEKLGLDPFDLRYKNVYREGSTNPDRPDAGGPTPCPK